MKQLDKYLFECIKNAKLYYDRECYLNSMQDFFGDNLPEEFKESLVNLDFKDYILESLTTHDIYLLKSKIEKEFNADIQFVNDKAQSLWIMSNTDISIDPKFKSMLEIFGYYITKAKLINGDYHMVVCPRYASDATDLVYKKNHGKLYHFTAAQYAKEIETKGLRCKKSSYRNFPERIYLYASDKHLDKIPDINKFIKKVIGPYALRNNELIVYRIDMNRLNTKTYVNFYTDDAMDEEAAVYTYNNIPPECITKINFDLNNL